MRMLLCFVLIWLNNYYLSDFVNRIIMSDMQSERTYLWLFLEQPVNTNTRSKIAIASITSRIAATKPPNFRSCRCRPARSSESSSEERF